MKKIIYFIYIIVFLTGCSYHISKKDVVKKRTDMNISDDMVNNSEDKLQNNYKKENIQIAIDKNLILDNLNNICICPRKFGTDGEITALNFLKNKLEEYGYITDIQNFQVYKLDMKSTYVKYNVDYFKSNPYNSESLGTGRNLIGKMDNHENTKKTILLTAHYDTTADTIGAIDNGTGVSVILEVARQLRKYDSTLNIEIVLFSAEEYFRAGSRAFVSSLSDDEKKNIIGCINVDMVGEKGAENFVIKANTGEHNILTLMMSDQLDKPLPILAAGNSDDLSFYLNKIPAVTLANKKPDPSRSKQKNQFQYINIDELENVVYLIANFIINFDIDKYNKFLTTKTFASNKTIDDHYNIGNPVNTRIIDEFEIKKINSNLQENGYDSQTEYVYERADGKMCIITQKNSTFINPSVYSKYKILNSKKSGQGIDCFYFINEDITSDTKVYYLINSYYGEIKGNISTNEALDILKSCYEKMYNSIFGK
ncbi:M28 family metallopeptidase [Pseudobacteroides cellulosolvens]|uniref:Peptidase M28 n=1 Tax=Pseudobacteroides cellulosolvens ATCC 35603 = DSM 2933 TaxID=398512 RepID=A0A0L6JPF6_9FIRM|nr:M28 family peptidase [Pseudobacteroides cellulosolvens]KNY27674.1 peptidase M28 [Pseudobacteroides cellulosolvens ATCC 35603 = DSM 2933]